MQIVAVTWFSYPTVRASIDLYEAGGWASIRPASRGRNRGDGRVLSAAQEEVQADYYSQQQVQLSQQKSTLGAS